MSANETPVLFQDILTLRVLVAQCALPHVGKLDRALGAGVHEQVTRLGMEFGRGDDLRQLFHVCWLDVHDVEALVLNVQVPQVDSKIIRADEGLPIAVHRYAVDVVCMRIGIGLARYRGDDGVVKRESRKLEVMGSVEARALHRTASAWDAGWRQLLRQVVLGHNLKGLLKDLP